MPPNHGPTPPEESSRLLNNFNLVLHVQPSIITKMGSTSAIKIPFIYRFVFLFVEPMGALTGAIMLHFTPQLFLNAMSPNLTYAASHQIIYDMLAATYVLFAFNEAV